MRFGEPADDPFPARIALPANQVLPQDFDSGVFMSALQFFYDLIVIFVVDGELLDVQR